MRPGSSLKGSLAAAWGFNEASGNAIDRKSGLVLVATNGPSRATGKRGLAASVARADGEYFTLADEATMSLGAGVPFGFSVWFQPATLPGEMFVFSKYLASGANREYRVGVSSENRHHAQWSMDGTVAMTLFGSVLTAGVWYHSVWTHDGRRARLYLNGELEGEAADADGVVDGTQPFEVGRSAFAAQAFDGLIDSLHFFKGHAPGAADVAWLYAAGRGREYPYFGW